MKRSIALLGLFVGGSLAYPQGNDNLFSTVRPDVIVVVREHATSSEIVQVTVLPKAYPPELLKSQIERLASYLGATARGIQMSRPDLKTEADTSFLRAEFATDGLIDRAKGIVRLGPIAKAFAGAPEPYTIHGIKVAFEGERTTSKMHQKLTLPDILELAGRSSKTPPGIEYQIKLLTQDPEMISVPDEYKAPANQKGVQEPSSSPNRALLIGLFLLAGVAVGALVYLALLRSGGARRGS